MIRCLTLLALIVATTPLAARAGEGAAAGSAGAVPAPRLDPTNVQLLPLSEVDRGRLLRDHRPLVGRLQALGRRAQRLEAQLARRDDPKSDGSKKIAAQRDRVQAQFEERLGDAIEVLAPYGVDAAALARVERLAPDGPDRVDRYAMRLVLELDLSDDLRGLLEPVVEQTEGALLGLRAQRRRLELVLAQTDLEDEPRRAVLRAGDRDRYLTIDRFWRLVDYVVPLDQRRRLRDMLPTPKRRLEQGVEHLYGLPGITPSQGTRLKALLTEIEAESAPDQALVKRLQADRNAADVTASEKSRIGQEIQAARARLFALQEYAVEQTQSILDDEQWDRYLAIPPHVGANERRERVRRLLEGVPLTPAQSERLAALERDYRERGRELEARIREVRRMGADYGPDSPQQGMMEMMQAGIAADGQVLQREAIGRVFTEILTPHQTVGWVIGLYGRPR